MSRNTERPTQTVGNLGDTFNNEAVPSSIASIAPILRVANEIEVIHPRVAHLCRFSAFGKAHSLDPAARGHGVRQFKTALLERLERDEDPTLQSRTNKSDIREMQKFCQHYYEEYIQPLEGPDKPDRAQLKHAYQTAAILFEVLGYLIQPRIT